MNNDAIFATPEAAAKLDFCRAPPHSETMTALIFDTLRLSRTLRDKGHFTSEQAEALAEASQGDLATKADLAEVRTEIAELRTELKSEIAATRTDLLKWIIGAIGFQAVVILGALISLVKIFAK